MACLLALLTTLGFNAFTRAILVLAALRTIGIENIYVEVAGLHAESSYCARRLSIRGRRSHRYWRLCEGCRLAVATAG
jgi:hypothetical protein